MKSAAQLGLAICLLCASSLSARAESYCVACYGPDAVYRCVVADAPDGAPPDPRHQIQCIKQIAKSDGHARCSVERFTAAGCDGALRVINPSQAAIPLTPPPPNAATAPAPVNAPGNPPAGGPEPLAQPAVDGPAEPPKTVEELAKTTVDSTKKGLDKLGTSVKTTTEKAGEKIGGVGDAIGNAAKKSWDCVTSLFSNC